MRNSTILGSFAIVFATIAWAQQPPDIAKKPTTIAGLKAEIEALRPVKVAWREIAWTSCLLDGLQKSRATGKPILLWVFIDRPTDDARC